VKGKIALITGGASGIGRATAFAFAREGASVVIGDLDVAGGEKTVADTKQGGGEASFLRMDVTQSADVQRLVAKAVDQYGGLDYAFNNAGTVGSRTGIVDTTEGDWNRVIALNLTSVWLCRESSTVHPIVRLLHLEPGERSPAEIEGGFILRHEPLASSLLHL
jgi:NAD(P)-dependent dehydrogenase (short-subunit alcohol dehydrogenase family)